MNLSFKIRFLVFLTAVGCVQIALAQTQTTPMTATPKTTTKSFQVEAESFVDSSKAFESKTDGIKFVEMDAGSWLCYDINVPVAGRYRVQVVANTSDDTNCWIEDYVDNQDGRTYNVTGNILLTAKEGFSAFAIEGSPLNLGKHKIKLHLPSGSAKIDKIVFTLMKEHQETPITLTQNMEGEDWNLVWSDEFDGEQLDEEKWTYDIGNWGWGNNELQYYTERDTDNARLENGNLIIEARKNDDGQKWTSARLTTRGKVCFLYGKIEMRAKVPREKGCWAAGWTLGDKYVDELSWPYCGEIDILESVGFEVNDETGDGIAHASAHTRAHYFKDNNHITSTKKVANMAGEFHTYSIEWTPKELRAYVDGEHYYTYDKNANEREWPFNEPQTILVNLAMGGGWGGAQGMNEEVTSQKYILDYVRVYEKK